MYDITLDKRVMDDIVCRYSKSQWDMGEALHWHRILKNEKGIMLPPLGIFFSKVRDHFDEFDKEMEDYVHQNYENPIRVTYANQDKCTNKQHNVVLLGKEESFMYYCPVCNAYWKES
ncbi:hypothetical protein QO179_25040 [Bacillus stercoris]|nr:hypothetical protein [Bacillus stercoris]